MDIIRFLIELAGQTAVVRDYLEESTTKLTEVRKEQMDVKRDWKRMYVLLRCRLCVTDDVDKPRRPSWNPRRSSLMRTNP